jgi:Zn-finger nucleic acid-binding protein
MILACPTCDSRYDVTGHAAGQQFRCRCGTMMTLHAASTQAGLLSCPQCGAGVPPAAHHCEYCNAELLLKACPRCVARVFHGYKHCPECGAELDLAASGETHKDMPCPRCATPLRARRVSDIVIDECSECLGLFLDHVAAKRVISDRQQARAEALLGALPRNELKVVPPRERLYIKCPRCATIMNRRQFATGAGVIIDVCKPHGTFFDIGELPVVIDFVMHGGLEKAERADIERQKRELARQREAYVISAHDSVRFDVAHVDGVTTAGSALVDLLFALFR